MSIRNGELFNMKEIRLINSKGSGADNAVAASAWLPDDAHHRQQFLQLLEQAIADGGPGTYLLQTRGQHVLTDILYPNRAFCSPA
jgi:hypothetical protein